MALGATLIEVFGPRRFLITVTSDGGAGDAVTERDSSGVLDLGVATTDAPESPSSSSSNPKDNFPLATGFRFFFGGCGVDALYFYP